MVDGLAYSLGLAVDWLVDIAQVKGERLTVEKTKHVHAYWKGAIRGEYGLASKQWGFFCPCWHTGQAIKALAMASTIDGSRGTKALAGAKEGAGFLMANQVWDEKSEDHGLILAYEDYPDLVNVSAVLESCDGLLVLSDVTADPAFKERVLAAVDLVARKFYVHGKGVFVDAYSPGKKTIKNFYEQPEGGRPLLDDAIFLKAYKLTGNDLYKRIFLETCETLVETEEPPGNWISFRPASMGGGHIHPRHAYWWGSPFIDAYVETGDKRYIDVATRAADWYARAIRADGGLMRETRVDFNSPSFGHATSGVACAVIFWLKMKQVLGTSKYDKLIEKCLNYCMSMQFRVPEDENVLGCILEKVLPPGGSDRSPYHVRDLGTIFFVQAACKWLEMHEKR